MQRGVFQSVIRFALLYISFVCSLFDLICFSQFPYDATFFFGTRVNAWSMVSDLLPTASQNTVDSVLYLELLDHFKSNED